MKIPIVKPTGDQKNIGFIYSNNRFTVQSDIKEKTIFKSITKATETLSSIESLLKARDEIDKEIKKKFRKEITVMFTDIVGSTSFFEQKGDIEGRAMVQKHNEILFPKIKANGGHVIKTIGDAIMAAFDQPIKGVLAAMAMQEVLTEHNHGIIEDEQIHIRIGIHSGMGISEPTDVYGDVVNVAARVESLANGDEILITKSVYDFVKDAVVCKPLGTKGVKGKLKEVEIYKVIEKKVK